MITHYSNAEAIAAITRNLGHLTKAARELHTTTPALKKYIMAHPAVLEEFEAVKDEMVDEAILQMMIKIREGDSRMIIFALENLGADRGFGTKPTNQYNTQVNMDLSNLSIEEKKILAKVAKEKLLNIEAEVTNAN
jgi:hypothetical protein